LKKSINILFFILVWVGKLSAQTNNFYYYGTGQAFSPGKAFSFDKNNKLILHDSLRFSLNSSDEFRTICDWQGRPLLYCDGDSIYRFHKFTIPNSNIKVQSKIRDPNINNGYFLASCDTSNYLLVSCNQKNNSGNSPFNDTLNDFLTTYIERDENSQIGLKISANNYNRAVPLNQRLYGMGATRDSTGQPMFVFRTTKYLYSAKVLKGGFVQILDSFPEYIFINTPDSIVKNAVNPLTRIRINSAINPTFNNAGDKLVYSHTYGVYRYGFLVQNVSVLCSVEFDKSTGKFSNREQLYYHNWIRDISPDNDSFEVFRFPKFSPNDRFLYINNFKRLIQNNEILISSSHISYSELNQLDMLSPIPYLSKILLQTKVYFIISVNHNRSLVYLYGNQELVNDTFNIGLVRNTNNEVSILDTSILTYTFKDPENALGINNSYFHIFDFLRIEQQYDYSCSATVQLRNTSLPDIGFTKYKWHIKDENDSLMVFEQFEPPPLTYTQNGNYAVQLFAQSPKGGGYGEWYIDTIRVRIPAKPIARFSASDTVVCQHLPVTFNNLSTDQQTHTPRPKEYLWDFGDGNTSAETNPVHTYTQPGDYTVSLHFRNGYCDSLLVKTNNIHVVDAPKPGFAISDTQGCVPMPITITDTTWFRVQSKEYYFSDIDQWLPMTRDTFNHTFHSSGVFRVVQKLIGISGCVIVTDSVWVSAALGITTLDTTSIHLVDVQNPMVNIFWKSHPAAVSYELQSGESMTNLSLLHQTPDTFFAHTVASAEFYQVQAVDSCGNKSVVGNYAKPVWLIGKVRGYNQAAELYHTPYEVWSGSEKRYHLQKFVVGNWITLRTEPFPLPYDDVNFTEKDSLQSCYRIQITDPNEASLVSHSNVLCLDYVPMLYLPNAFSPNGDGLNDVFELNTIGITTYTMRVFNQWGQKVFEGLNSSWDGTFQGMECPAGVYMVLLSYTNKSGMQFETGNTLHLIR
jgi:gliding motility-associated-like protein